MDSEQPVPAPPGGQAGTGGGLRYIRETPTPRMANQEHNFSCVIACVRQLLRDAGAEFPEAELTERIGVLEGFGSEFESAGEVLTELHPRLIYAGGAVDPEQVDILFERDPWVARVRTLSGRYHAVIVDGVKEDVVSVRDPWGLTGPGSGDGTEATITLQDFLEHWRYGIQGTIVPTRLKVGSPS